MRVVRDLSEVESSIASVKSEALNSFGDDAVLLERYFDSCRHIEIQIFGDMHGNVTALGERDCSVQRRYQKVVEESPSPFMTADLRSRMCATATAIAKLSNYVGAGTVEFLVDADRNYYFLEVNTRLQVEHPVTEIIHGLDLVELQVRVAEGRPLSELLSDLEAKKDSAPKHAIECRLYAEDPTQSFFPATGTLHAFVPFETTGVRYDTGVRSGSEISVFYDPMIAKVISYGKDRQEALSRMIVALERSVVLGVTTNKKFLLQVLRNKSFEDGDYDTRFIGMHFPKDRLESLASLSDTHQSEAAVAVFLWKWHGLRSSRRALRNIPMNWSNSLHPRRRFSVELTAAKVPVALDYVQNHMPRSQYDTSSPTIPHGAVQFSVWRAVIPELKKDGKKGKSAAKKVVPDPDEGKAMPVTLLSFNNGWLKVRIGTVTRLFFITEADSNEHGDEDMSVFVHSASFGSVNAVIPSRFRVEEEDEDTGGIRAVLSPVPCKVLKLPAANGSVVKKGDLIAVVESMKMEMKVFAPSSGTVSLAVKEGAVVKENTKLMDISNDQIPVASKL